MTLILVGATAFLPTFAQAAPEPRTAAAVIAADDKWGDAESHGDAAFVDGLLLPGYRSIGNSGATTTKAQIVDGARKRGDAPKFAAEMAAWKRDHPMRADVTINRDTAVLRWMLKKSDGSETTASADIFVYRDGRWHALYSQHTGAAG